MANPARRPLAAEPPATDTLPEVLAELAEIAAETLELQDVFDRVATAVRRLIPFDNMGVIRVLDGEWAVAHATTVPCGCKPPECSPPEPLSSWSPRFRPRPGPIRRLENAEAELDAAFPVDAQVLAAGVRSGMWEPFRLDDSFGGIWICSFQPHAFGDEHQQVLRPIAALLGSAVEHWRIWDAERRRRDRLDRMEELFGTLAESLDVREIFERISLGVQDMLPHDALVLTELDLDRRNLRIVASAGTQGIEVPAQFDLSPAEFARRSREYELCHDIQAEIDPTTPRQKAMVDSGMRSWLRVPVWRAGRVHGGLGFFAREPSRYTRDDVEVASRLADRLALMLSHHQLAEEARLAAEARERAERLEATVETLTRELEGKGRGRVVGASPSWRDVLLQVGRVAPSETTVLITGESGTGKEIIARLVREGSPRAGKPFVAVNCAALPEQLLESELFGHEKGAFTGAVATKFGRLEQAAGGTLFLDEIGEMSPLVQAKFLRVLQEREFQRLGGTRPLRADVRVIAATNRDLEAAISRGAFREDLYYRLNVFQIAVPPLRERRQDVLPLAEAFLEELGRSMGRPAAGISRDAREWLLEYPWPGNVRELRNAIERAILLCDGGLITRDHLPAPSSRLDNAYRPRPRIPLDPLDPSDPAALLPTGGAPLRDVERGLIERALREARGNKSRAARLLGLTRAQLYSRLEKHGLNG